MKILVTGGAGFIGSHLVDMILRKGHDVVIIDDLSTGKKENLNEKAIFYKRDIKENFDDIFEKEKPEIVFHLAAQVMLRDSIENPIFDAKTNIIGTINVLETCRKFNIKKIIYTSTGGARIGEPKYFPVDEKHPLKPLSPYGISKHTAEHYVQAYGEIYGIDYLIFGFGNVYGPRDNIKTMRLIPIFISKMLKGESPLIFGDGDQKRDFVYVLDLVKLLVESIEKKPKHHLFHLANGKPISVNEIFKNLKELMEFKGEAKYVEPIKGEVREIYLNTSLAEKELNWKPEYNLTRGLKETVRFFK